MKNFLLLITAACLFSACIKKNSEVVKPVVATVVHDTIPDGGVLWLGMKADSINTDQCVLAFNHTSSLGFSYSEDAKGGVGGGFVNISTQAGAYSCAINRLPYKVGMTITLGVHFRYTENAIITVDSLHNIPSTINIWLKDSLLGDSTNLRVGNAHISGTAMAPVTIDTTRFKITLR